MHHLLKCLEFSYRQDSRFRIGQLQVSVAYKRVADERKRLVSQQLTSSFLIKSLTDRKPNLQVAYHHKKSKVFHVIRFVYISCMHVHVKNIAPACQSTSQSIPLMLDEFSDIIPGVCAV